jgi:PDDEXK-like domain of unknown function (DUF3799)
MTAPLRLPPGIYTDVAAADYHADPCEEPSLSSSIAKVILADTPRHAWTKHPRLNPAFEPKDEQKFSLGSVAHELILGKGAGFDVLDYDDWRKREAQEKRDASWAAGRTPILAHQFEQAIEVSNSAMKHVGSLAEWDAGKSEVVAIWNDIGGALCRAMLDRLSPNGIIFDVKTTDNGLSDAAINRLIPAMDYDLSAGMYVRGLSQLRPELAGRIRFWWLWVEISAPFECRLIEADATTLALGDRKAALAIEKWRKCVEAKSWPGYPPGITLNAYPPWAENAWLEREVNDDDTLNWKPLDGGNPMARIARDLRMAG